MRIWDDRRHKMKKTLYLYKSGQLMRRDSSLVLLEHNKNVIYIPIHQIDQIICFSEINVNKKTLGLLNSYGITILFFNYYGNYIGRFTPKKYYEGKVLVKQVEYYADTKKRMYIAKQIIRSSMKNELSLLKYYHKKGHSLNKIIDGIQGIYTRIEEADCIESLLLLEAEAKQYYYQVFDIVLKNDPFTFGERSKNPPKNEINAMMSYGYSILYSNYLSVIDRSSLYPQISFIHSLSKNSDSLQFDLADILKPVFIDRLILRLIRKHQIQVDMFDFKQDGRCYLNKNGIELFVQEYDKLLKSSIMINNKSYSYKLLISREVHLLSNYIKEVSETYEPYVMGW